MTIPAPPPRQTQSFLRNLFHQLKLHPKNKLGQNFLIDLNLLEVLLGESELTSTDLVLEVGTGTGSLTGRISELAGGVLSVEIDPHFFRLAEETLGFRPHVKLLHVDILKNKNLLNPDVMEPLRFAWQTGKFGAVKLTANLPYAVATPVISNLLLSDVPFERMVATVQWEIAERLLAEPGCKEYGALAVLVQSIADVELIRKLPPTSFWPKPQVHSAIVRIKPNAEKRARVTDPLAFRIFLRDLYAHRRKHVRGGLLASPARAHVKDAKEEVDGKLAKLGIDFACRAETLDVEQHLRLFAAFGSPLAV
jgi:16S rRNA (adenine1518-N6/adenine1519-N6)-dimethyltransferase